MDQLITNYFRQGHRHQIIVELLWHQHGIRTSIRTVKRILQRLGLKRNGVVTSDQQFQTAVAAVQLATGENNFALSTSGKIGGMVRLSRITHLPADHRAGYRRVWHILRRRHQLQVTQERTRLYLRQLNPAAVNSRTSGVLTRRRYISAGPNHVWHCDGYDKLKPYGFALHGCIDGFSRRIMWLHCSTTNNDPKVILWYYLNTVQSLRGAPTLLRSDCGTETGLVAAAQCTLRNTPRSHVYGPSYRNQRIESWWSVMRKGWAQVWMDLFDDLVSFGAFDPSNPLDKAIAEFCFLPIIQEELDLFHDEWNTHRIRRTATSGCPGGIPVELFILPERYGFQDHLKSVSGQEVQVLFQEASPPPITTNTTIQQLCHSYQQEQQLELPRTRQEAAELFLHMKSQING